MKHIAHFIETLGSGGAEKALLTYIQTFNMKIFKHTIITLYEPTLSTDYWKKNFEVCGVNIFNLNHRNKYNFIRSFFRLRRFLKNEQISLLSTHLFWSNFIGRLAGKSLGIPVISTVHNPDYDTEVSNNWNKSKLRKHKLVRLIDKYTVKYCCNHLIAVSDYTKNHIISKFNLNNDFVDVIYNPVKLDFQAGISKTEVRRSIINEFGLIKNHPILFSSGRVTIQKGHDDLVRCISHLRDNKVLVNLLIAGNLSDVKYVDNIIKIAEDLNVRSQLYLIGERRDVHKILRGIDIFVFPSRFEGMGISLAEAMIAECPIVAYNIGPISELIENSISGSLIESRNWQAFAEEILLLLRNSTFSSELAFNAKERASLLFSPNIQVNKFETLINKIFKESNNV